MAKLSKQEIKQHEAALKLLEKDVLSIDDKFFVLENYCPDAAHVVSKFGAFFTPVVLARDFAIECNSFSRIVDLCAGIGALSFAACRYGDGEGITCVELNDEYLEIGKKILPKATWIHADVLSDEVRALRGFEMAISNPPFGNIAKQGSFEYAVIKIASQIAGMGCFILPQMSTPFKYSGNSNYEERENDKYLKFSKDTGIEFEFNCGIDTSVYLNDWKGVSPMCEIVVCDFTAVKKAVKQPTFTW